MREIEGFVLITSPRRYNGELLYGPRINHPDERSLVERFDMNGLVPFETEDNTKEGKEYIEENYKVSAEVAHIHLTIPENNTEEELISQRQGLIVIEIFRDFPGVALRGPITDEDRPSTYPIPGAFLQDNGYVTWLDSVRAKYVRDETIRQATNPARLAQLKLDRIGSQAFLDLNLA